MLADRQAFADLAGAGDQRLVELLGALVEGGVQLFGVGVERRGARFELLQQVAAAGIEVFRQLVETAVELVGECQTGRGEGGEQAVGAGRKHGADRLRRAVGLLHQHGGARVEHRGEGLARRREALCDVVAGAGKLILQLLMRTRNRGANALGMADDGFALGAQFLHERAHTHFIVGVAALQGIHFRMHQGFQLGGARDGALDAFVHRRHFAANGLTDGHDTVGGDGFRLGKAKRDFSHRAGGAAQFMGARDHDREGEEQHDRHDDGDDHADGAGKRDEIGDRADLPDLRGIQQIGNAKAADDPENRGEHGGADRRAAGAHVQRFQDRGR